MDGSAQNVIVKLHTNIILLERNITKNYDNDTRHEQKYYF